MPTDLSNLPRRRHADVLREMLDLKGARLADIGCGDGGLVRFLTREGAEVTGVEPQEAQLARARSAPAVAEEDYVLAGAENLPFESGRFDIVVFSNSLHHVPLELIDPALVEATRILKPGGQLYIQEPVAEGPFFELVKPVEDETFVRAKAYEALKAAAEGPELEEMLEYRYVAPAKHSSFEAFADMLVAVDPRRKDRLETHRESLRAAFMASADQRDGEYWFDTSIRVNLLRKTSVLIEE